MRELPKLNSHANVTTVGYVLIDYCRRPLSEVYADIEAYAGWATGNQNTGIGVEGIFLDETPNHYSKERAEYLQAVGQHIKATGGILGDQLVSGLLLRQPLSFGTSLSNSTCSIKLILWNRSFTTLERHQTLASWLLLLAVRTWSSPARNRMIDTEEWKCRNGSKSTLAIGSSLAT
jgi:hypothetical protein